MNAFTVFVEESNHFYTDKKVSKVNFYLIITLTKAVITNDVGDDKNKINIWQIRDQDGTNYKLTK